MFGLTQVLPCHPHFTHKLHVARTLLRSLPHWSPSCVLAATHFTNPEGMKALGVALTKPPPTVRTSFMGGPCVLFRSMKANFIK